MAKVIEILRAYEILKRHGLNLPILGMHDQKIGEVPTSRKRVCDQKIHITLGKKLAQPDLAGKRNKVGKEHTPAYLIGDQTTSVLVGNIQRQRDFLNQEREAARVLLDDEDPIDVDPPVGTKSDNDLDIGNPKISQLLDMKQTTEELYGAGVFDQAFGEDLARILNKVEVILEKKKNLSNEEVVNRK